MESVDKNKDGKIDFEEFSSYLFAKEERLKQIFDNLDENNDGKLDYEEIKKSIDHLDKKNNISKDEIFTMLKTR